MDRARAGGDGGGGAIYGRGVVEDGLPCMFMSRTLDFREVSPSLIGASRRRRPTGREGAATPPYRARAGGDADL